MFHNIRELSKPLPPVLREPFSSVMELIICTHWRAVRRAEVQSPLQVKNFLNKLAKKMNLKALSRIFVATVCEIYGSINFYL